MELKKLYGLFIPKGDAKLEGFKEEFEGLPDLDVSKNARAISCCKGRRRAIDIGAHIGAVSVYLSRHFSLVDSFEASPSTFEILKINTNSIANITAYHRAVGDCQRQDVYLNHADTHTQLSHVDPEDFDGSAAFDEDMLRVGPIQMTTIDSYGYDDVDFIKIDVEGFELSVLQGAKETIKRCKPLVLFEQAGNDMRYYGKERRDEATDFIASLGMKPHPKAWYKMQKDKLFYFPKPNRFSLLSWFKARKYLAT